MDRQKGKDFGKEKIPESAVPVICEALKAQPDELEDIMVMKKGMTNRSFLFSCRGKKYIIRIPGEGTDRLISRRQEAAVYQSISKTYLR